MASFRELALRGHVLLQREGELGQIPGIEVRSLPVKPAIQTSVRAAWTDPATSLPGAPSAQMIAPNPGRRSSSDPVRSRTMGVIGFEDRRRKTPDSNSM